MSIERAIEKARQLHKAREAEQRVRAQPPVMSHGSALRTESHTLEIVPEGLPGLPMLDVDFAECERNRILLANVERGSLSRAEPAFRLLRSRIQHRASSGDWFCLGITSAGPGEGKTVVVLNLALSIAREKQRKVILLDLDMRNPSVMRYLGARPAAQISDFLGGEAQPEEVLHATLSEHLLIAGNGSPIEGPSEMLAGQRLDELLTYIRGRVPGGLVLIDLPPVTSTDEALLVAPRTDAMFLVVREGRTRRDDLVRTVNLLGDFNVAGIILNESSESVDRYYGYRY